MLIVQLPINRIRCSSKCDKVEATEPSIIVRCVYAAPVVAAGARKRWDHQR